MSKPFAWSFSALNAFETCPRQYHEMRIKKTYKDVPGEAAQWGKIVHKHLEDRIKYKQELPPFLTHVEPLVGRLESFDGQLAAEYQMALNADFQPTEWFARDTWVRAQGDAISIKGPTGVAVDWKSGKFREGDDQLRLQSAIMFATYPQLEKVGIVYAFVKEKQTLSRTFTRNDVPMIWQRFLPRVQRMEQAFKDQDFPPKPSGLCRKWCLVKSCEFHGQGSF